MTVIAVLLAITLLLFVSRGGIRSGRPLWTRGKPIVRDAPVRLILFVALVLFLMGFLVRPLLSLGDGGQISEEHRSRVPPPFALAM